MLILREILTEWIERKILLLVLWRIVSVRLRVVVVLGVLGLFGLIRLILLVILLMNERIQIWVVVLLVRWLEHLLVVLWHIVLTLGFLLIFLSILARLPLVRIPTFGIFPFLALVLSVEILS